MVGAKAGMECPYNGCSTDVCMCSTSRSPTPKPMREPGSQCGWLCAYTSRPGKTRDTSWNKRLSILTEGLMIPASDIKQQDNSGTDIGNRNREQNSGDTAGDKSGGNPVIMQILKKPREQKSGTEIRGHREGEDTLPKCS